MRKTNKGDCREDCIKIHAIIHNQLSAPIYIDMIQYAWYASKLTDNRNIFLNVNQGQFPPEIRTKKCTCGHTSFISCAWCREFYCFICFYDKFHILQWKNCTLSFEK